MWHVIHTLAATYDESKKKYFVSFITSLCNLLPCPMCRRHFIQTLKKYPLDKYLQNNKTLFLWSYLIHNDVNERKNVKSPPFTEVAKFFLR